MLENKKVYFGTNSMSIISTSLPLLDHYQEPRYVSRNLLNNQKQFIVSDTPSSSNSQYIDPDKEKILITLEPAFYHVLSDSLGAILYWIKKYPDAIFLIDMYYLYEDPSKWNIMHSLFFEALGFYNVSYKIINLFNGPIEIDNFYIQSTRDEFPNERFRLLNIFAKELYGKSSRKNKKVYISRKNTKSNEFWSKQSFKPGNLYQDDTRIYNEKKLEDYFLKMGFEILYAEDFKNVQEQISFFKDVSIIAGPTGSGLTNSIFLDPGAIILEITVPMVVSFMNEDLSKYDDPSQAPADWIFSHHNIYKEISDAIGHTYISVSVGKNAEDIIEYLDNSNIVNLINN